MLGTWTVNLHTTFQCCIHIPKTQYRVSVSEKMLLSKILLLSMWSIGIQNTIPSISRSPNVWKKRLLLCCHYCNLVLLFGSSNVKGFGVFIACKPLLSNGPSPLPYWKHRHRLPAQTFAALLNHNSCSWDAPCAPSLVPQSRVIKRSILATSAAVWRRHDGGCFPFCRFFTWLCILVRFAQLLRWLRGSWWHFSMNK